MRNESVIGTIEKCFSFLDKRDFAKMPFVVENLEAGITYSDRNRDQIIVVTYDKREHTIDCGIMDKVGHYSPLYEFLSKFPSDCPSDELETLKRFCTMPVSKRNASHVIKRIATIVDRRLSLIKTSKELPQFRPRKGMM